LIILENKALTIEMNPFFCCPKNSPDRQACNGIQDGEYEPRVIYIVCVHLFIWIGLRLRRML
jgi:hypothetical protein